MNEFEQLRASLTNAAERAPAPAPFDAPTAPAKRDTPRALSESASPRALSESASQGSLMRGRDRFGRLSRSEGIGTPRARPLHTADASQGGC